MAAVARKNAGAMDTRSRVDHDIAGAAFTALGDFPGAEGGPARSGQYQFVFARTCPSQVSRARETRPLRLLPIFV